MEGRSRSTSPSRYCTTALDEEYIFVFLAIKRDCFFSVVFGSGLAHFLKLLLLYQKIVLWLADFFACRFCFPNTDHVTIPRRLSFCCIH